MNKVELMGRLTKEPETKVTPNGTPLTRLTLAVSRRFAGKDAAQTADFVNCVAWRKTGEFIQKYFHKGNMIAIVGHIQSNSWDDEDGRRHFTTTVIVDEAYFTGSKAEAGGHNPELEAPKNTEFGRGNAPAEYLDIDEFEEYDDDDMPF